MTLSISAPAEDEEVFAEDYDDHLDDKVSSKPRQPLPKFTNEDLNPDKITYMVSAGQNPQRPAELVNDSYQFELKLIMYQGSI